jgi:hypothetical protein
LLAPWPYVIALGLGLLVTRKLLPLKAAGLFISFIILFLSFDVGDSVVDKKTATFRRISRTLKINNLSPGAIRFYNCLYSDKEQSAISFYYNKLIPCSDNLNEIMKDKEVKAIVVEKRFAEPEISLQQIQNHGRVIHNDEEYFILLKSNSY